MRFLTLFAATAVIGVLTGCSAKSPEGNMAIVDFGPRTAVAGHQFNGQPDGSSAAWFKVDRSLEGSVAWVHFGDANIQGDISGSVVTVKVPAQFHDQAREVPVSVDKIDGTKVTKSDVVTVVITK